MADLADRVTMDCMSDQADSQLGRTETTPEVLRPDIGAQSSASSLADSNILRQNSDGEQESQMPQFNPPQPQAATCEDCDEATGSILPGTRTSANVARLQKGSKVCASPTDTPETGFAVQRAASQASAGMNDRPMERLSSLKSSCANDQMCPDDSHTSHAALTNSSTVQNEISGDQVSTYPNSSHAMDATDSDALTNGTNGRSIQLSRPSSPLPSHGNNDLIVPHPLRVNTPSKSTEEPTRTDEDVHQGVSSRQHDRLSSDQAQEMPPRKPNGGPAEENTQQTMSINSRHNERQVLGSPPASNANVPDKEKSADVACPHPSPPSSTPKDVIIKQSYAEQGFGHVPLQFCPSRGDLSGETFNPYEMAYVKNGPLDSLRRRIPRN